LYHVETAFSMSKILLLDPKILVSGQILATILGLFSVLDEN